MPDTTQDPLSPDPRKLLRDSINWEETPTERTIRKRIESGKSQTFRHIDTRHHSPRADQPPEMVGEITGPDANSTEPIEFVLVKAGASAHDVHIAKVRTYLELIKSGKTPTEAAKVIGETVTTMSSSRSRALFKQVVQEFNLTALETKALVRAARLKVLEKGIDTEDHELILDATKQIATDPEVGLSPHAPLVNIDARTAISPEMQELFSKFAEKEEAGKTDEKEKPTNDTASNETETR